MENKKIYFCSCIICEKEFNSIPIKDFIYCSDICSHKSRVAIKSLLDPSFEASKTIWRALKQYIDDVMPLDECLLNHQQQYQSVWAQKTIIELNRRLKRSWFEYEAIEFITRDPEGLGNIYQ